MSPIHVSDSPDATSSTDDHIKVHDHERGAGPGMSILQDAMSMLDVGLGRYEAGLTAALLMCHNNLGDLATLVLSDLVEAAVRSGHRDAAGSALDQLRGQALASGTRLARGLLARSRALLADDV